jgi:predicted nucleic acid-binding protein
MPASEPPPTPCLVLDTNAVLDWLLFRNPAMNPLAGAIESGAVRWIATARMRAELVATLGKASLARWNSDSVRLLTTMDACTAYRAEPQVAPGLALHCTDPDDQVFIDLAIVEGARWLITQDRALLKLARRAALRGVTILPPARWTGP